MGRNVYQVPAGTSYTVTVPVGAADGQVSLSWLSPNTVTATLTGGVSATATLSPTAPGQSWALSSQEAVTVALSGANVAGQLVVTTGPPVPIRAPAVRLAGIFDVRDDFGAVGDGVTDDTAAIQAAINAAQLVLGKAFLPPGNYLINAPLVLQNPDASLVSVPGPVASLVGAVPPGRIGDASDVSGVTITCGPNFPVGEYAVQVLGPNASLAPSGCELGNFELNCTSRGAGILLHQPRMGRFHDLSIQHTATPSGTQPFSVAANAAYNVAVSSGTAPAYNVHEHINVAYSAVSSFFYQVLSKDVFEACFSLNPTNHGYLLEADGATFIGCNYSGGQTGWYLANNQSTVVGSTIEVGGISGPAIDAYAVGNAANTSKGLVFVGCILASDSTGPLVSVNPNGSDIINLLLQGCTLNAYGNQASPTISSFIETAAGIPGSVHVNECVFIGKPVGADIVDNAGIVQVHNSPGYNPVGSVTVAIPASGTAVAAVPYDQYLYITASTSTVAVNVTDAAGTSQTVATIPASAYAPVFIPAGSSWSLTYTTAPTALTAQGL